MSCCKWHNQIGVNAQLCGEGQEICCEQCPERQWYDERGARVKLYNPRTDEEMMELSDGDPQPLNSPSTKPPKEKS